MKRLCILTLLAGLIALIGALPLFAQENEALEEDVLDMETFTCGEFLEVFETDHYVTHLLGMWAHGYSAADDALDLEKYPLSKSGLEKFFNELLEVCREDKAKLFIPAVLEMD